MGDGKHIHTALTKLRKDLPGHTWGIARACADHRNNGNIFGGPNAVDIAFDDFG